MNSSSKNSAGMPLTRIFTVAAAVAMLSSPIRAEEATPLRYGAGVTFERDTNLFLRDEDSPGGVQSDNITTGYAYLGFDTTLSRQRLYGNFNVGAAKFNRFSEFDYDKQDINVGWEGNFPHEIRTVLSWTRSAQLANFADFLVVRRNVITRDVLRFDLDVPVVANWHLIGGLGANQSRNSDQEDQVNDLDGRSYEAGVRYVTNYGNRIDLVAQNTSTDYTERSARPWLISGYDERLYSLRLQWAVSGTSRLEGYVGYIDRTNENFERNDFSAPNFRAAWDWDPGSSLAFKLSVYRTTGAAGDNEFLTATTTALRFAPVWRATGKITLKAYVEAGSRDYLGAANASVEDRVDDFGSWSLGASYSPFRWLMLDLSYRGQSRDSNRMWLDYINHTGIATVQVGF
ncbi:outer membrane beta-barrel protein [Niveibacterium sp. 24ML]|uniref:outer membrane beta-barrel protein n=1 Tax=Niveibacterium sp. 24ML TaxID=2985512 RepID=UPI0022720362|nr:outer membrane beta-barrel protein [Niveibacterium sp. 24ML]MCX9156651.1 outer membrane beta-barrel protein [Niveibacterium sp. 24ML]